MRGRLRVAELSADLKGVLLTGTFVKPGHQGLAVLSLAAGRVFLLSELQEDLFEAASQLLRVSLPEMVVLHEFCRYEYGLVEKQVAPVMLDSASDLMSVDIAPGSVSLPESHGETLWWEKWGGVLYRVSYCVVAGNREFSMEWLHSYLGKYESLPSYRTAWAAP
jgi:hypothetical protein